MIYSLLRRHFPIVFLIGFGFFIFAPVVFGTNIFSGQEDIGFHYAISYYVQTTLDAGHSLAWIPSYYGGVPTSVDQFFGTWYPIYRIFFSLFNYFTAHHLIVVFATIAGLLLTYAFGRAQGWTRAASICLALFYLSATTYEWLWVGTTAAHSFAILPGVLLALHYAAKRNTYVLPILGGGLALGIGFLHGFMQIVFYDYIIAGLYALYLDWTRFSKNAPILSNLRISFTYAAITLAGLLIGFPQFYPSASMIDLTIRTSTYAIQNATEQYPTEFLAYILPPLFNVPFFSGGHAEGFFITIIGIISAFIALRYYRTPAVVFFAGVYVLFEAFAWHLPVFSWINEHLPPFSHMGGNFRWTVAASFPLAFLGAAGLEGLLRNPSAISERTRKVICAIAFAIPLLLVLGSIALTYVSRFVSSPDVTARLIIWYTGGRTLSFEPQHYVNVFSAALRDLKATFSLLNPDFVFGILFALAGALFFYVAFFRRINEPRITSLAVGIVAAIVAGTMVLQWDVFVPRSVISDYTPDLARIITERESDPTKYRLFGYLIGDGAFLQTISLAPPSNEELMIMSMQSLANNASVYFGIERMDGMEPYRTLRHNRLLDTVIAHESAAWIFDDASPALKTSALNQLYNRDVQKKSTVEEKVQDFPKRLPLLSMMNVKYVYSPFELSAPSLRLVATIPVGVTQERYSLHLYENTLVLPRIYIAHNPQFVDSERKALLQVISEDDFSTTTWIECATCESRAGAAEITIEKYDAGNLEMSVAARTDSWLVFSESAFPGWKAMIDGVETPIYMANYLFQAVKFPEGEHAVRFVYEDVAIQKIGSFFGQ